jgi:acetyl-CoA acetyltransferase
VDNVDHHRDEAHALVVLEHVRTTGQALELAEIAFHTALRDAQQAGNPLREIARYAGLSHQRVHQITRA